MSGIVLRLRGLGRATRGERADVRIGDPGTYRTVLRLRPGRYRVGLSLLVDGRRRSTSVDRRIRDRRAYAVSLEVREGGVVTMLPVTSY
ncbi:hypothetical protein [Nocardioides fonticola]|uniref:hypothetical protein n=1 Tax=Nocardioides fonticola TaxID=450363 RepID=UPI0031DD61D8